MFLKKAYKWIPLAIFSASRQSSVDEGMMVTDIQAELFLVSHFPSCFARDHYSWAGFSAFEVSLLIPVQRGRAKTFVKEGITATEYHETHVDYACFNSSQKMNLGIVWCRCSGMLLVGGYPWGWILILLVLRPNGLLLIIAKLQYDCKRGFVCNTVGILYLK